MRDLYVPDSVTALESVARLLDLAVKDTGQSRRAANFLLTWHAAASLAAPDGPVLPVIQTWHPTAAAQVSTSETKEEPLPLNDELSQ